MCKVVGTEVSLHDACLFIKGNKKLHDFYDKNSDSQMILRTCSKARKAESRYWTTFICGKCLQNKNQ